MNVFKVNIGSLDADMGIKLWEENVEDRSAMLSVLRSKGGYCYFQSPKAFEWKLEAL